MGGTLTNRVKETERVLKALANRRRLSILKLLQRRGATPVGSIAESIRLSFAATSRHLRVLASADLVESEQTNTTVSYSLAKYKHPLLHTALETME